MENNYKTEQKLRAALVDEVITFPIVAVPSAFRNIVTAESLTRLFKGNIGNPYGQIVTVDNGVYNYSMASNIYNSYVNPVDAYNLVLLNLPNFQATAETKYIPIIASDGSGLDNNVITGYANISLNSTIVKEGSLKEISSASESIGFNSLVNSYVWNGDQANGTTTHIAWMRGIINNPYSSLMSFKNISNYNFNTSGSSIRYGYVIPNVKDTKGNVLTGPSQILTFEINGQNKWFYDVLTGEKRAVQPDEFAYNWNNDTIISPNNSIPNMTVYGDYLFYITGSTLYKIEIATGANINSISVGYTTSNRPYGVWVEGTNIMVSTYYDGSGSSLEGRARIYTVNPDNMSTTSVNNIDYTGWGNLPKDWIPRQTNFNKIRDNYYIVANGLNTIICSDITNVCGTIIGLMPSYGFNTFMVGEEMFNVYQQSNADRNAINSTPSTNPTYNGIYLSNNNYCNFQSLGKSTTPMVKTAGQQLSVEATWSIIQGA